MRGYRKRYGVTLLSAAEELKILGIEVSDQYISQLKTKYYTSGGVPFGIA